MQALKEITMSNEKVLVTGGNGFLALHIIQHLLMANSIINPNRIKKPKAITYNGSS
jgi:nucleoside-diphosphate-sugar epimerase